MRKVIGIMNCDEYRLVGQTLIREKDDLGAPTEIFLARLPPIHPRFYVCVHLLPAYTAVRNC